VDLTTKEKAWALVNKTGRIMDRRLPSMGAALAYYTLSRLRPLLLLVISIAGLVFGRAVRGKSLV
jgi:membrane protein